MESKTVSGNKLIFGYLGLMLIFIGIMMVIPCLVIPFLGLLDGVNGWSDAEFWPSFVIPGAAALLIGLVLYITLIKGKRCARLTKHEDLILLPLIWLVSILVGTVPFLLRNFNFFTGVYEYQFNFVSALFETASGYCSIGLTVFKGLGFQGTTTPTLDPLWNGYYLYTFYRSELLFFGGVGLVLVVTSTLSDRYGINLYEAEGHNDRLIPNLRRSAKMILGIYIIYIVIGTIAYILSGMSIFDAINTSISAISTGGFTPHAESIAYYSIFDGTMVGGVWACNGLAIEIISMVLMLLGCTNFITHYLLFSRKFKKAFRDTEMKLLGILILVFVPLLLVTVIQKFNNGLPLDQAFRYSIFHMISCISTTGFSNCVDAFSGIEVFGTTAIFLMTILMFIGGGAGSTSGAIKLNRLYLCIKNLHWTMKAKFNSKQVVFPRIVTRHGEPTIVTDEELHETNITILLYLFSLIVGTIIISLITVWTPQQAAFEFMSALSSTGLSLFSFNAVGQNANEIATMILLVVAMFIGRLEILPVISGIKSLFKHNKHAYN